MTYDDMVTEEPRLLFVNQNSVYPFSLSFDWAGEDGGRAGLHRDNRVVFITSSLEELHDVISMIRMETVRRLLAGDIK